MTAQTTARCGAVASNAPGACVLEAEHVQRGEPHCDVEGLTWKRDFKHGRPDVYEITWMSGHVERALAHQVTYPHSGIALGHALFNVGSEGGVPRVRMHAEIDGRWTLTLSALEKDIRTMRLVTGGEAFPGGAS